MLPVLKVSHGRSKSIYVSRMQQIILLSVSRACVSLATLPLFLILELFVPDKTSQILNEGQKSYTSSALFGTLRADSAVCWRLTLTREVTLQEQIKLCVCVCVCARAGQMNSTCVKQLKHWLLLFSLPAMYSVIRASFVPHLSIM